MFDNVKSDLRASCEGSITLRKVIFFLFASTDFKVVLHYRINNWFYRHGFKYLSYYLACRAKKKYGIEISPIATIGKGFRVVHGLGTVIGNQVVIGKDCTVYQNVTLGTSRSQTGKILYPVVRDNVIIYAGAKVLGGVNIGNNVVIAANAVVVKDVNGDVVVGGVPAKEMGSSKP